MNIKYKLSKDEIIDFHLNHYIETIDYKYSLIFFYALTIIMILIRTDFSIFQYALSITMTIITGLLFWKRFILFHCKYKLKKKYSARSYKNFFGQDVTLHIDDTSLIYSNSNTTKKYKLDEIDKVAVLNDYIYIQLKTKEEFLFPTYVLGNNDNCKLFCKYISDNTNVKVLNQYPKEIQPYAYK